MQRELLEERICASCIRKELERLAQPYFDEHGRKRYEPDAVEVLSERSGYSTRTIYRALEERDEAHYSIVKADELLLAAGSSLYEIDDDCVTFVPSL